MDHVTAHIYHLQVVFQGCVRMHVCWHECVCVCVSVIVSQEVDCS